jgi:hypothetical protein
LALFDTLMANIPYQMGLSPKWWQHGMNALIQKKKGNIWVDTLCIILLFEPNFNQHNKKISKDMMYMAEQFKVLADKQFSSQKCLVTIDHRLNKTLTCDISHQLK